MATVRVLAGGTVVDGSGRPGFAADVVIDGSRVAAVLPRPDPVAGSGDAVAAGRDPATPDGVRADVIDVTGLVVAPGFIDVHTHSDFTLLAEPAATSRLLQGVTTEIVGNCGYSAFPLDPDRIDLHMDHHGAIGVADDDTGGITPGWRDHDGWAAAVHDARPGINVGSLVGHGTARVAVMGFADRAPSVDERARILDGLDAMLAQGALGVSTGLTHAPSAFATDEEVLDVVGVASRHGRLYVTHARVTAGREHRALEELVAMTRATGARTQFSHVALNDPAAWGTATRWTDRLDAARDEGLDIAFDVYPYAASSGSLSQFLPHWLLEDGPTGIPVRLGDAATFARARDAMGRGWYGGIPWHWDRVLIASCPDERLSGRTLAELARSGDVEGHHDPVDVALTLCRRYAADVTVVMRYRTEEDLEVFLRHPAGMIGSDGSVMSLEPRGTVPHPRSFGCMPRLLGHHVRERGVLHLEQAVHRMTAVPAVRFGLTGRGILRPGAFADVVAFDPMTIAERGTFRVPRVAPVGVAEVLVSGQRAVVAGRVTATRAGQVLTA